MTLNGEIELSDSRKTTWQEVKRAILSKIPFEDIVEIRAFGSCVRELIKITHPGSSSFFGFFKEPDTVKTIYPNDIDVLVITKGKPPFGHERIKVKADFYQYGESWGYGFSYPASGYRDDMLHVTMMSKEYWDKALIDKDTDAVRINSESITF